jgi:putative flippase GtrA
VLDVIFFQLAGWLIWPCLRKDDLFVRLFDLSVPVLTNHQRSVNAMFSNLLAFTIANFFCYILNVKFVFKPGRHHWFIEMALFYLASGVSIVLGTLLMGWLIVHYGMRTDFAFSANLVTSLLINYAMRKFVIFKG